MSAKVETYIGAGLRIVAIVLIVTMFIRYYDFTTYYGKIKLKYYYIIERGIELACFENGLSRVTLGNNKTNLAMNHRLHQHFKKKGRTFSHDIIQGYNRGIQKETPTLDEHTNTKLNYFSSSRNFLAIYILVITIITAFSIQKTRQFFFIKTVSRRTNSQCPRMKR